MTQARRKVIRILGGGIGGLTTAFELTSQPGWQDKYEVHLHQLGWRLGGKCASSRGDNGRIEEHGIHGFLGSYYNAIPMVKAIYDELKRPPTMPISSFETAMVPMDSVIMWEFIDGQFKKWPFRFPPNDYDPAQPWQFAKIEQGLISVLELLKFIHHEHADHAKGHGLQLNILQKIFDGAIDALEKDLADSGPHPAFTFLDEAWQWLYAHLLHKLDSSDSLRHLFLLTDYLLALTRGALKANVLENGYDQLDDQDWGDWLKENGASAMTLTSSLAINTINLSYQNPHGDTTRQPVMAAGTYLHWTLRSFAYLGHAVYAFAAGTGETMIAPLYELLKKRGVNFHFFHKIEGLHVGPDPANPNGKIITSVDIGVQATLKNAAQGAQYEPLVPVKDLPCWPPAPLYDQLVQGKQLAAGAPDGHPYDLESWWTPWQPVEKLTLTAGDGANGYDELVFAISIGAVPHLCSELIAANPAWDKMVKGIPAVLTQTMQIWLQQDSVTLGWDIPYTGNDTAVSGTFMVPINGMVDFHHLIPMENWPADNTPKGLWYFSGVMDEYGDQPPFTDHGYPQRQHARVRYQCIQFLQATTGFILPKGTPDGWNPPGDPICLDFNLLVDTRPGGTGPDGKAGTIRGIPRFESQFWRANIDPTERYVTSPPGSTACRIKAWETGFTNLTIAGDWIYTGLNVGSFEGTVMSGKLASHALTGVPALDTIIGYPKSKGKAA